MMSSESHQADYCLMSSSYRDKLKPCKVPGLDAKISSMSAKDKDLSQAHKSNKYTTVLPLSRMFWKNHYLSK